MHEEHARQILNGLDAFAALLRGLLEPTLPVPDGQLFSSLRKALGMKGVPSPEEDEILDDAFYFMVAAYRQLSGRLSA